MVASPQIGIDNTEKLFKGCADVAKMAIDVLKDGKIGFSDIFTLINGISKFSVFATISYSQIGAELKDLSKEELLQLINDMVGEISG